MMELKKEACESGAALKALVRWETLAPSTSHCGSNVNICTDEHASPQDKMEGVKKTYSTYANEQNRERRKNGQHEEERDHLGRAPRIGAEDVVDLVLLAIPHRLLVLGRRDIGV